MKKILAAAFATAFATGLAVAAAGIGFSASAADAPKADLVNRQQLRVCSDPADLPFSNDKQEGFENKIADIIASELKVPVTYTWFPKATGFIRMTLFAKKCDLVIGWGQGDDMVLNTNAIYRSVSALIYKAGTGLDGVESLADPKLKGKKIGIVQNDPGGTLAAKYGHMGNMKGYRQMVDRRFDNPAEEMMKDIRSGEIDAGIHWGPIASYWAGRGGDKLVVVPLRKDAGAGKIAFRITMGVRNGDDAWKRQLNEIIARRQGDIDKVLLDFGIPVLVDDDTSTDLVTAPRKSADATGAAPAPAPATAAAPAQKPAAAPAP
jgi:quinoprotein dehydrogenase-associated probable ABC transporter substrate-binding protein